MNPSLQERCDEIAAATKAQQQVEVLLDLMKSPKLPQSRDARRDSWAALVATAQEHLSELDRLAAATKRVKKRAPATDGSVPVRVEATGQANTTNETEAKQ